jgi:UDP-galactopyranose mutase
MQKKYLIIGAGFSGSVLANQLASQLNCKIDIWDERDHIGGNCHTSRDEKTGIMVHRYGPHIFNTDKKEIWDFVNQFIEFRPYVHRVKAMSKGKVYSLPVNLHTINQLFGDTYTPESAQALLASLADQTITNPQNFEEQALRFIGKRIIRSLFLWVYQKAMGMRTR